MDIKVFDGDYNKREFYSFMGKFFAEREYRRIMPYLVNEDGEVWIVAIKDNEVMGFTSYLETMRKIEFGYTFSDNDKVLSQLLENRFDRIKDINKPIEFEITKEDNLDYWLDKGFVIIRETKNYYFLRKEKKHE